MAPKFKIITSQNWGGVCKERRGPHSEQQVALASLARKLVSAAAAAPLGSKFQMVSLNGPQMEKPDYPLSLTTGVLYLVSCVTISL